MDLERITHSGYKLSVLIAIVLSMMVVTFAAVLGRGALNLKGALLLGEPTPVTVIAAMASRLEEQNISISGIEFLRKEKRGETEKPYYAYQVKTSDEKFTLVKLGFDEEERKWVIVTYESLHADPVMTDESGVPSE